MKKMKKSIKIISISLALALVFAASVVAAVFIFKKPTSTGKVEQFSEGQRILLNKIIETEKLKQNSQAVSLVQTGIVQNENQEILSDDNIYAYYDGYVIGLDENKNKILYVSAGNKSMNVLNELFKDNLLKAGASNISAIKVFERYVFYSYNYQSEGKTFVCFEIANFADLSNLKVENSISFELQNNQMVESGSIVSDVEASLFEDYFEISYASTPKVAAASSGAQIKLVKKLFVYGSETPSTFEYDKAAFESEIKSQNQKVAVSKASSSLMVFSFLTNNQNGTAEVRNLNYALEADIDYKFFATNQGVFIEKQIETTDAANSVLVDDRQVVFEYEFANAGTFEISDYALSEGAVRAEFDSTSEFLLVFEMQKDYLTVSENGFISYFDESGELVVKYAASSINSKILYANLEKFVTSDGIFETKKLALATLVFDFNTKERNYEVLSQPISGDWFVVRNTNNLLCYLLSIDGEIFGNEFYISLGDLGDGKFLAQKNKDAFLIEPGKNFKQEIKNHTDYLGISFSSFGLYLQKNDDETYSIFDKNANCLESNVSISVFNKENYVAVTASKENYSKTYYLSQNDEFGSKVVFYGSTRLGETQPASLLSETTISKETSFEYFSKVNNVGGVTFNTYPTNLEFVAELDGGKLIEIKAYFAFENDLLVLKKYEVLKNQTNLAFDFAISGQEIIAGEPFDDLTFRFDFKFTIAGSQDFDFGIKSPTGTTAYATSSGGSAAMQTKATRAATGGISGVDENTVLSSSASSPWIQDGSGDNISASINTPYEAFARGSTETLDDGWFKYTIDFRMKNANGEVYTLDNFYEVYAVYARVTDSSGNSADVTFYWDSFSYSVPDAWYMHTNLTTESRELINYSGSYSQLIVNTVWGFSVSTITIVAINSYGKVSITKTSGSDDYVSMSNYMARGKKTSSSTNYVGNLNLVSGNTSYMQNTQIIKIVPKHETLKTSSTVGSTSNGTSVLKNYLSYYYGYSIPEILDGRNSGWLAASGSITCGGTYSISLKYSLSDNNKHVIYVGKSGNEYAYFIVRQTYDEGSISSSITMTPYESSIKNNSSDRNATLSVNGTTLANGSSVSDITPGNFSLIKIKPNSGNVVRNVTVTIDGHIFALDLNYNNTSSAAAVTVNSSGVFTNLLYSKSGSQSSTNSYNIQYAYVGSSSGWSLGSSSSYNGKDGSVFIGINNLRENVTISYTTDSYLNVLFKQFKKLNADSQIQIAADSESYISEFNDYRSGYWFNDRILSQVYSYCSVNNNASYGYSNFASKTGYARYYSAVDMSNRGSYYGYLSYRYNKIAGYDLVKVVCKIGDTEIDMTGQTTWGGNVATLTLNSIKTAYENAIAAKELSENKITVTFYSDLKQTTLKFADDLLPQQTLTYNKPFQLPKFVNSTANKKGYSFVGWVSLNNRSSIYWEESDGLFVDENTMLEQIASSWRVVYEKNKDGNLEFVNSSSLKSYIRDFYVDNSWFVTDSGTGRIASQNYNFYWNYVDAFENGTDIVLYPVWMANDYVVKFTLGTSSQSTKPLFKIEKTSYDYLNGYKSIVNNGFNFELSSDKMKIVATENIESTSEFYVQVRYDTNRWYYTDTTGNVKVYEQAFLDTIQTTLDRYGYSFVKWTAGGNEFARYEIPTFNEEFYDNLGASYVDELSKPVVYDYMENPIARSATSQVKQTYFYGSNGGGSNHSQIQTDGMFLTSRLNSLAVNDNKGEIRTISMTATWEANDYYVRYYNSKFEDESHLSGDYSGSYYTSAETFTFDNLAYSDAGHISQFLSKLPYKRGYDFAGWTLAVSYTTDNDYNESGLYSYGYYTNYWIEQLEYTNSLETTRRYSDMDDDLLRYYNYYQPTTSEIATSFQNILHCSAGSTETSELLGDVKAYEVGEGYYHYVYFYPNWSSMTYSIEVDLNIPEGYEHVSNELFAGLFESVGGLNVLDDYGGFANSSSQVVNGFKNNKNAIASFNFMKDGTTYKSIISNVRFRLFYGQRLRDAHLILDQDIYDENGVFVETKTITFYVNQLYVVANNLRFEGWDLMSFVYNDDGTTEKVWITGENDSDYINLDSSNHLSYFEEIWHNGSNYGYVLISGQKYYIYRDIIVEKDDDETIYTERLYFEKDGERIYLSKADHGSSGYDFDTNSLYRVVGDQKYYIYNDNETSASKTTYYLTYDENGHPDKVSLSQTTLNGLYSGIVVENKRLFRLVADFEVLADPATDITITNDNASKTGFLTISGTKYNLFYRDFYDDTIDEGSGEPVNKYGAGNLFVAYKNNYASDKEDKISYQLVEIYYAAKKLRATSDYLQIKLSDYYATAGITGTKPYQDEYVDIMFNSSGAAYINLPRSSGTNEIKYLSTASFTYKLDIYGGTTGSIAASNISWLHHFSGLNEHSNEGLAGAYNVTFDEHSELNFGNSPSGAEEIYQLSQKYYYDSDGRIDILPAFNGRYLTEISFEFKHLFEDELYRKSNTILSDVWFEDVRFVIDFFFDNNNRTIGIEQIYVVRGELYTEGAIIYKIARNKEQTLSLSNYLNWWKYSSMIDSDESINVDEFRVFIENYFNFMNESDFLEVGDYQTTAASSYDNLKDFNLVVLKFKNLKKHVNVAAKFAVQTYDINIYSVLNDSYNQQIKQTGEKIETPYATMNQLKQDIDTSTSFYSKDYTFTGTDYENLDNSDFPKLPTVVSDSNEGITLKTESNLYDEMTYNVPYGYYAYGYAISSAALGERPIDINSSLIKEERYGFKYIYNESIYQYQNSSIWISAETSDYVNVLYDDVDTPYNTYNASLAQNGEILANPHKVAQSVRNDKKLNFYSFGGLYFIDEDAGGSRVYFNAVTEADENTYLNQNRSYYAYYYLKTSASQTGFYAWDDVTMGYQKLEDLKDGYAYQKIERVDNFIEDGSGFLKVGTGANNLMYTFTEYGLDTESFAQDFSFLNSRVWGEFETEEYMQNYVAYLQKVAQTYWFISKDGKAEFDSGANIANLTYDEANKMYKDSSGKYHALSLNRNSASTYYGATLFRKDVLHPGYYELVTDIYAFNPTTDSADNYVAFQNYYVFVEGNYYKIDFYSEQIDGKTLYNPYKLHSVDSLTGKNYGNSVKINGTTYYFNYKEMKLFESNKVNFEVDSFKYEIVTPLNQNYGVKIAMRDAGFGLYGITFNSLPDEAVDFWQPGTEFLFWAGMSEDAFGELVRYSADESQTYGSIFTLLIQQYQSSYDEEYRTQINEHITEFLKDFTFEDLLKSGVNVGNYYKDTEDNNKLKVSLEFVVEYKGKEFWGSGGEIDMTVNVEVEFEVLQVGTEIDSSIYAIQVYQKNR